MKHFVLFLAFVVIVPISCWEFPIKIPHIEIPRIEIPHIEIPHIEVPHIDVQKITEQISKPIEQASRDISRATDQAAEELTKLPEKASEDISRFSNEASHEINKFSNQAANELTKLPEKASEDISRFSNEASHEITKISNQAAEGLSKLPDQLAKLPDMIKNHFIRHPIDLEGTPLGDLMKLTAKYCDKTDRSLDCIFPIKITDTETATIKLLMMVPEDEIAYDIVLSVNDIIIHEEYASVTNPPPICLTRTKIAKIADLCVRAHDLRIVETTFHSCVAFDASTGFGLISHTFELGCITMELKNGKTSWNKPTTEAPEVEEGPFEDEEVEEEPIEEETEAPEEPAEEVTEAPEEPAEEVTEAPEEPAEEVTEAPRRRHKKVTKAPKKKTGKVTTAPETVNGTAGVEK